MVVGARHARGARPDQAECGRGFSQEETYEVVRELKHDAYIRTSTQTPCSYITVQSFVRKRDAVS
jgi:hypothetical protein